MKNESEDSGFSDEIAHLPLSKDALLKSITELVSENNPLTDYEKGYNNWKEAFDNDNGGVFYITVNEAVEYVEETLNNAKPVRE